MFMTVVTSNNKHPKSFILENPAKKRNLNFQSIQLQFLPQQFHFDIDNNSLKINGK